MGTWTIKPFEASGVYTRDTQCILILRLHFLHLRSFYSRSQRAAYHLDLNNTRLGGQKIEQNLQRFKIVAESIVPDCNLRCLIVGIVDFAIR